MLRIEGGTWRGRKLESVPGDATRPTAARLRQALFNALGPRVVDARVLDCFAGTGALGLEALSRGAIEAVLVERAPAAQAIVERNIRALGAGDRARLVREDVWTALPRLLETPCDGVLVDPPYRTLDWERFLAALQPGAGTGPHWVMAEHGRGETLPERVGTLVRHRHYRHGESELTFYRREGDTSSPPG